ncbi:hypothetical protein EA660_19605 [Pseudoxanthomonas winnipegensis]|uniref:Uncharacterized protein n=1 Tax=Pseudoxanthomonas winnipegensis TaxID=2480810 RepID=A0A4Q8L4Z1_9GAMM|nr:hypothetical protein EA660_19605 [Pseudoxanthomonas winnipegensis]
MRTARCPRRSSPHCTKSNSSPACRPAAMRSAAPAIWNRRRCACACRPRRR